MQHRTGKKKKYQVEEYGQGRFSKWYNTIHGTSPEIKKNKEKVLQFEE